MDRSISDRVKFNWCVGYPHPLPANLKPLFSVLLFLRHGAVSICQYPGRWVPDSTNEVVTLQDLRSSRSVIAVTVKVLYRAGVSLIVIKTLY